MWRALPKERAVPHRRDFNPARAASLLRHIMLVEMRLDAMPSFPVRLVGGAAVEKIQRDLRGHDYLEFMPAEYHSGVIESARLMLDHPCGLWQVTPLHFERGIAQCFEVTAFPLFGDPWPFSLALFVWRWRRRVRQQGSMQQHRQPDFRLRQSFGLSIQTATPFCGWAAVARWPPIW